ncbi:2Fe-2S iron-sulfur cluster-binding protein [Halorussus salinisoli]|uniref:2Fe-2S iron-sulfur cluster-binding protein n=1 Tax=Halorussus salinisoli TaxID=2558242 RepID=UPI0010C1C746|nr:2Fe-2S iron-sulfur cluster-binding protein [Halorussus salinisoli]
MTGDPEPATDESETEPGAYEVALVWRDGDRASIRVSADETVLSAAERANLSLPFGCRTGACATCTGRLLAGRVEHARPPRALKDRHLDAGYVLLCIAEPRADCRVEVGVDVQTELVSNPWK